jgi:hypothetical protein
MAKKKIDRDQLAEAIDPIPLWLLRQIAEQLKYSEEALPVWPVDPVYASVLVTTASNRLMNAAVCEAQGMTHSDETNAEAIRTIVAGIRLLKNRMSI